MRPAARSLAWLTRWRGTDEIPAEGNEAVDQGKCWIPGDVRGGSHTLGSGWPGHGTHPSIVNHRRPHRAHRPYPQSILGRPPGGPDTPAFSADGIHHRLR